MKKTPEVSVIIPCSRPERLDLLVKAIKSLDPEVEVIIVGDCADFKNKTVNKIIGKFYPGEARNIGARAASGEYLIFIDDDCFPCSGFIRNFVKALKDVEIGAVSGKVIGKSAQFFSKCTDFTNFDLCQIDKKSERILCSAAIGLRKEVFQKINGFDDKMRVGEDTDLCFKLITNGYKTVYEPSIIIFHDHKQNTLGKLIKYMYFGGKKTGLQTSEKYGAMDKNTKIFKWVKRPEIYFFFIVPFSLFMATKSLIINISEHPKVILYYPFIFLGKLSYNFGVFNWLREKNA